MMRRDDEMDDERLDARMMSHDAVEDAVLRYLDERPELVSGMAPARDLWPDIEARIGARVLPLGRESIEVRRAHRRPAWLATAAAAAFLVASTAGVTYVLTKRSVPVGAPTSPDAQVATHRVPTPAPAGPTPGGAATTEPPAQVASAAPERNGTPEASRASSRASSHVSSHVSSHGSATTLARYRATPRDEARVTYDDEITRLHDALEARRAQLDPATVATVERNLHIIDDAIAQARAALATDPHSQLLNDQLDRTLAKKTELLRTATLLPSA